MAVDPNVVRRMKGYFYHEHWGKRGPCVVNMAGAAIFGLGVVFGRRLGDVGKVVSCGVGVAFVTDFAFQTFNQTRWRHVLVGAGAALVVGGSGKEMAVVGIAMTVLDFVGKKCGFGNRVVKSLLYVGFNLVAVAGVGRACKIA